MINFIRMMVVLAAALLTAACATDLTQARSPCVREPGGWCGFTRDFAVRTWEYAQLANDTYDDEEKFAALPEGITQVENDGNGDDGIAYAVYDRMSDGKLAERIMAFRGTEFSFDDWFAGNLSGRQNDGGMAAYQQLRQQLDDAGHADVPISVAGHSLGGAIAAHIALRADNVSSYAFNQSPRFTIPEVAAVSRRLAVTERGEALGGVRDLFRDAPQDMLIINCRPKGAPWKDHSIRKLSECLTWIAAYDDPRALASVRANGILRPFVQCGDRTQPHPGRSADGGMVICPHNPRFRDKQK
ncbi:alpha/beta hydrolase fold domain-containing protein [Altererythrobacter confluentis]|uniref:Alpha/beta hydrolase fold domain-containing protein n=1 Tax=Allopontixanthobacter confluentis TaxID=1849021 RepID=A0A6L7GHZ7_9SPHN|nr:alpha/beta hydrolase fold domain-containing protein [Allopontixanthobacter confluentis]MXP14538.1 alpha/beta hydrolase fold domain-containing protein [Allopontixanthobacter confluentis]